MWCHIDKYAGYETSEGENFSSMGLSPHDISTQRDEGAKKIRRQSA